MPPTLSARSSMRWPTSIRVYTRPKEEEVHASCHGTRVQHGNALLYFFMQVTSRGVHDDEYLGSRSMLSESDSYDNMADALKSNPPLSARNSMMADFNRRMGEAEELAIRGAFKKCLPLAQEILDDLRMTTSSPDSHFLSTTSHQCDDDCICIAIVLLIFQLYHETRQSARIRPLLEQCYGSLELWPIEVFEAWYVLSYMCC